MSDSLEAVDGERCTAWADVGVCGCHDEAAIALLEACLRDCAKEGRREGLRGAAREVAGALLQRLGLVEHGVSIRFAFVTTRGRELLAVIEALDAREEALDA